MIIKEINLRNIRSHENTKIAFSDGINIITGNTGSGKSSILMGVQYALFGKIGEGQGEGKLLLRRGKQAGSITLKFTEDGSEYVVTRGLKKVKDAVRNDDSENEIIKDGRKIDLQNRATDVNSYILKILKINSSSPTKTFEAITYIKQDELKDLIFENGQSKQEYIDQLLQLNKYADAFDKLKDVNDKISKELESTKLEESLSGDENEVIQLESEIGKLELNNSEALKNLRALEADLKSNEADLDEKENEIRALREQKNEFIKLTAERDGKLQLIGKYVNQAAILKKELEESEKSIIKVDDNLISKLKITKTKKTSELKDTAINEKAAYEAFCINDISERNKKEALSKIEKDTKNLQESLSKFETELKTTKILFEKASLGISEDEIKGKIEQINLSIEELKKERSAAEKSGVCALCGAAITNKSHLDKEYSSKINAYETAKESFLEKIKKKTEGKTRKELEIEIDRLNIKIADILKKITENESELKQSDLSAFSKKTAESKERYDYLSKISGELKAEIDKIDKDLEAMDDAIAILNKVRANREKLDYLDIETQKAREEANIIEDKIKKLGFNQSYLNENERELTELSKIVKSISSGVSSIKSEIKSRESETENRKVKLEEVKKRMQRKNELRRKIEKKSKFLTLMENLRKDIREIREYVRNRFISEFKTLFWERFLEIRAESDYNIDIDNNYNIKVIVGNEVLDAKTLSGGEKTSVALAYRMALSSIASLLGGISKNESLIMDEPTSGLDREDINALSTCITKITDIKQIVIVTHEDIMKNIADTLITVTKNSGESKVN